MCCWPSSTYRIRFCRHLECLLWTPQRCRSSWRLHRRRRRPPPPRQPPCSSGWTQKRRRQPVSCSSWKQSGGSWRQTRKQPEWRPRSTVQLWRLGSSGRSQTPGKRVLSWMPSEYRCTCFFVSKRLGQPPETASPKPRVCNISEMTRQEVAIKSALPLLACARELLSMSCSWKVACCLNKM
jgi:hypothetical protein